MPEAPRSYKSLIKPDNLAATPQVAYVPYAHLDVKEGDEMLIGISPQTL